MTANGNLTIGLIGSGGDGVVLLGTMLQHLGAAAGYFGQLMKFYGAQIRGGGSAVKLNLNATTAGLPGDTLDILVCFDWAKRAEFGGELPTNEHTLVLCESAPEPGSVPGQIVELPLAKISQELTQNARNKNIVAFGVLVVMLGFAQSIIDSTIANDPKFRAVKANTTAFDRGCEIGKTVHASGLATPCDTKPKTVISGNEAVVAASISGGAKACAFYPITPASDISESMGRHLLENGGAFRQSEDEIAAIMNAIGASLAGAKALVATSGPGFSLMTEALSLAIGAEIPLVLVDVQRGGPSTGLPTKTEQSDLFHAVYGGHGDAPRVVLAPHDIESVWRLTREAFNISEGYQVPVVVLSDQLLGQSYVACDGAFLKSDYPIVDRLKPNANADDKYRRYENRPDHVSPMANFGDPKTMYQASGLSHREDGSHSSTHQAAKLWHTKISRKLDPLSDRDDLVRLYGNREASDLIITWGSSAQAVLGAVEACDMLDRVLVCVPELISPIPLVMVELTSSVDRLMVIEMNASAQYHRHLRSDVDLPECTSVYNRSGGQPFGIDEISRQIAMFFYGKVQ